MKIAVLFAASAAVKFRVHPTADDEWQEPQAVAVPDQFLPLPLHAVTSFSQVHWQPGAPGKEHKMQWTLTGARIQIRDEKRKR